MNYIESNKEAWEEAFELRHEEWGKNILEKLKDEKYPYLVGGIVEQLEAIDIRDKTIGHFCCNDGRELLSVVKNGAKLGVGFDIAENMVAYANDNAAKSSIPCEFVATNILEIPSKYDDTFDVLLTTVGALNWFKDLKEFFGVVSRVLKKEGILIVQESHPLTNLLAYEGEEDYNAADPAKIINSYFKSEAWVSDEGIGYLVGQQYESKEFIDYSHTLSEIINAMIGNGINITKLEEFEEDLTTCLSAVSNKGIPLSMIIVGKKM